MLLAYLAYFYSRGSDFVGVETNTHMILPVVTQNFGGVYSGIQSGMSLQASLVSSISTVMITTEDFRRFSKLIK